MHPFTEIPPGVRFDPNGEEVVSEYLIPKINGCDLQWPWIAEMDVYSADPWIVFSGIDRRYWSVKKEGGGTKSWMYVFAKVTKSASNRNSRRAGSGTWSGQTGPKNIVNSDNDKTIGCMRMLSFKQKGRNDLNWVMHEYSLPGEGKNDIVLCKITKFLKDSDRPRPQQLPPPPQPPSPTLGKADQLGRPPPPPSPSLGKADRIGRPPPPLLLQPLGMNSLAKADQIGNPRPPPLLLQPLGMISLAKADQIGNPPPPLLLQPLGMISLAKADQIGNPPPPQPLGFPVPDQPWMDSVPPMAYEFGNPQPLGSVVPENPWICSPAMAYPLENPPPLGFPMPDQPPWNYLPMADCIGTPVPDQDQPLSFQVVDPITNKRPAQDQPLLEESSSEQKKSKTFWENLLESSQELKKMLDQSDQIDTPAAATAINTPMMSELKELGLESEYMEMIHLLELDDEVG